MKRRIFLILISAALLLSGCSAKSAGSRRSSQENNAKDGYELIFVCPIIDNEYWKLCLEGVRDADEELGTHTRVIGPENADNFTEEIVGYMEEAVAAKPDGIMAYSGIEKLFPLIDKAQAEGIPVISIDSDAPHTSRLAYVGSDVYSMGLEAGQKMAELIGQNKKIGYIMSSDSSESEKTIRRAFSSVAEDYGISVAAESETGTVTETAEQKAAEMLRDNPDISGIFCTLASGVTGAARAKKTLGRDDLVLVGFDGTDENIEYVREGVIDALIVRRAEQTGYQGVYAMKQYLDGKKLLKEKYDTGSILVTADNADTYNISEAAFDDSETPVRVGYYDGDVPFQDGCDSISRKSGYAYDYYQEISTMTGWKYDYVYGSREEILRKLAEGEVDIAAGVYKTESTSREFLFSKKDMGIAGNPRYFAVSPEKPELLRSLDTAMERISQLLPNFETELYKKYYTRQTEQSLTDVEKNWLRNVKKLRIGYVSDNMPLSGQNSDGSPTGVVKDLSEYLSRAMHIEFEPVCYDSVEDMEQALSAGDIDAAFPIYSDLWLTEKKGFRQTDPFLSDSLLIAYKGGYSEDIKKRVAVNLAGLAQQYHLSTNFPDSEFVNYKSRKEAFDAVISGKERCVVGCTGVMQRFILEHPEYSELNIAHLESNEDFCIAVNQSDSVLAGIINKFVRSLPSDVLTSMIVSYSGVEPDYTLTYLIKRYATLIIAVMSIITALLSFVFIQYYRRMKIFSRKLARTNEALENALEEANEASKAKTNFLSSMSHDIRTPMNAIFGMTKIAVKNIDDRDKVSTCLNKISLSSRHLLTLINDVLDISKIESGKLALNPVNFSIRDMITSILDIVNPIFRSKDLEFDVYVHDLKYEVVRADEVRVNQIFINILTNAAKYTENGSVTMDLYEEIIENGDEVILRYVVEDTGIGMSSEFMKNMYSTFVRAEDSRTNKIQGTGLGLAIVKQIVDAMEGTIECESEENKGTKFTVTLKLPVVKDAKKVKDLSGVSVLIADDDEIFLETASSAISSMGAEVATASGGEEALRMMREAIAADNDYSVYIVDWKMPGLSGEDTIREIRGTEGGSKPIILASAYEWADIEAQAKDCGADMFISKPLFNSNIYEKIYEVLGLGKRKAKGSGTKREYDLKGRHILVAEDNDINWEVITELLAMYGITSELAENGKICVDMLESAQENAYDLVLMDIQMPVMNGRDAARAIRQSEKAWIRELPVIAMTADAFAEDIAACLEAGMNSHVSKPVDMDVLCQEIEKVLGV